MLKDARKDMREELKDVGYNLSRLMDIFLNVQMRKDNSYDGSWAKRGLSGYMDGCLGRQIDRIEPLMDSIIRADADWTTVKGAFDTLFDISMYSAMGVRLLAVYFPQIFDEFIEELVDSIEKEDASS